MVFFILTDLWLIIPEDRENGLHIKSQPQPQQKTHFLKPEGGFAMGVLGKF